MPRLSIEISEKQHQRLKVMAALNGKSIKDLVLSRALGEEATKEKLSEEEALTALHAFLEARLQQVRGGKTVPGDFAAIREKARSQLNGAGD